MATMPVCPVCEHLQEHGEVCDACGLSLGEDGAPEAPAVPPLEALEPTAFDPDLSALDPDPMPELEPTFQAPAPAPPPEAQAWVERTAHGAVEAVALEPLELERTAPEERERTRAGPPTCRYCRTEAKPGEAFCPRCGMRLAGFRPDAVAEDLAPARCDACGSLVLGSRCRTCGAVLPSGDEAGEP